MSGNGWQTGMARPITGKPRRVIRKDLRAADLGYSAVGPGAMHRTVCVPQPGYSSLPRCGATFSGSVAPRTLRTNLFALTLFPVLRGLVSCFSPQGIASKLGVVMTDEGAGTLPTAVTKAYDVLLWHINKFPHSHRFVLGDRSELCMLSPSAGPGLACRSMSPSTRSGRTVGP